MSCRRVSLDWKPMIENDPLTTNNLLGDGLLCGDDEVVPADGHVHHPVPALGLLLAAALGQHRQAGQRVALPNSRHLSQQQISRAVNEPSRRFTETRKGFHN